MPSGKGEALALQASQVVDAILLSDFGRRGGRRKLQEELLKRPPFVELRRVAHKKGVLFLAVELLKFYDLALEILIARATSAATGKVVNTQDFWSAQQEIKRAVLGAGYEEHKYLDIFVGLDFLAGQKVRDESELSLAKLRSDLQEKITELTPQKNSGKEIECEMQTAQI